MNQQLQTQAQGPQVIGEWDGLPFRVQPGRERLTLKSTDPVHNQPVLVRDAQVRVFDLSKPEDLRDYQIIYDLAMKGKAVVDIEKLQFCADINNWRILLRWVLLAYEQGKPRVAHFAGQTVYLGASDGTT